MMKLLLIGASGQLGSDLSKEIRKTKEYKLQALSRKELNILNFTETSKKISTLKPNIIINTAAFHNVDEAQINYKQAFNLNSYAQENLARTADKIKAISVYISSDYVFGSDINKKNPYKESDFVGPANVYGISKLNGELFTALRAKKHFIIRTAGLFGINGPSGKENNFIDLMINLSKTKKEINVVSDQIMTPTYTKNLSENIMKLIRTNNFGLYHMSSEGQCSWYQVAKYIFLRTKSKVVLNEVQSSFFKNKAPRPSFSVLENFNLKKVNLNYMNDWKENIDLYLKEKYHL